MKNKVIAILTAIFMLMPQTTFAQDEAQNILYDYFRRLMAYASQLYIDENVTTEELIDNAIKEVIKEDPELLEKLLKAGFSSLDEYSEYYTADEFQKYLDDLNHTFYGIGVIIRKVGDYVEITKCLEDGSAYAAGLDIGDKIYKVNGENVVGKTLDEVQLKVVGELDTEVEITVLRGEEELTFNLVRKPVSDQTVSYTVLKGDIGYINIINFANKTDEEFAEVKKELDSLGIKKIILDLRDNPGGYLESAINIAKTIVPEGVIAHTIYRSADQNETFFSKQKNLDYEFAVLVNENTASAAEVLSGAMQDSGIGTLVGKTTYGKAVIQEVFRLATGAFKLTTGHYLTRNGNEINKIGIEPDVYVLNTTQRIDMTGYTPFDYKIKWKVGDDSDSVKAAKERLRKLGFYRGEINTQFDRELEEAVTRFQAATDLYPYGVLDISTQVRIENETYNGEEIVDRQFERAYELLGGVVE